jgi:hypothetical protein
MVTPGFDVQVGLGSNHLLVYANVELCLRDSWMGRSPTAFDYF